MADYLLCTLRQTQLYELRIYVVLARRVINISNPLPILPLVRESTPLLRRSASLINIDRGYYFLRISFLILGAQFLTHLGVACC